MLGDIKLYLIGNLLSRREGDAEYSFPSQFSDLVPGAVDNHPLSPKVVQTIESDETKTVMGKAGVLKK